MKDLWLGDHCAIISISRSMITSTRRIDAQMPLLETVQEKEPATPHYQLANHTGEGN